ncbi:MAG: DUF839 domain-containing protein, partial [Emcibacteraceae bacterium]|nr:DUF839 domain-containing protein [Emcibacteraceae bacterium]
MSFSRRTFVAGACTLAFSGLLKGLAVGSTASNKSVTGYGSLVPDDILDLPQEFSYKIISAFGDKMNDGYLVPNKADGMGCFALEGSKVALIR